MSLYDVHADGSGSCYASRRRPLIGLRPDFVNWMTGGPRHFGADLYIIDWLEHVGVEYDVLGDEDLHNDGQELLDRYRVLITGSHPEYCTEAMLDALQGYLNDGGRLMYLGGNGFYWAASIDPARPHVMEVRRGMAGTRPWDSEPGELHHSTTGEPGGLWRHRGRPPNHLVGVGFCAQGWDNRSHHYIASDPQTTLSTSALKDIAPGTPIGQHGLAMGSAVGDEIDRFDPTLGSPQSATVLASSALASSGYQLAFEDWLTSRSDWSTSHGIRADMVIMSTPNGGATFSASSVSFASGLQCDGYRNGVAKILHNVLTDFTREG
jgi:N,N-dimethylformamidase